MKRNDAIIASAPAGAADAGDYPARPLRFVVGFTPGGSSDTVARIVEQRLAERLWSPGNIRVERRP